MTAKFNLGETKHVRIQIHSAKDEDFEITEASFELIRSGQINAEDVGACVIYEHIIDTIITPQERGGYYLKITYKIADETLIAIVTVRVD